MDIEFCPECGNLLRLGRTKEGKVVLRCGCGYSKPYTGNTKKKKFSEYRKKQLAKKTLVINKVGEATNPTTTIECPKCGYMTAEYFQMQTRSADEPPTTFYRCLKCNNRWRKY
ncbi:MAG: transcription factor S [Promethearchaeota archaeon]